MNPAQAVLDAAAAAVTSNKFNGYTHSHGAPPVRAAVAKYASSAKTPYVADDVYIGCGASQALLFAIQLLCNPGDEILIPVPGFPLYETIACHIGAKAVKYQLLAERSWEADVSALDALVTPKTRCLLINNPGNPTGSNYSLEHVTALADFARRHKLPVIADEIYAHMVFAGETFTPLADVAADVPVFTIGGIAKRYLVPGWRVGWIAICDRAGRLKAARPHLISLTQVVLGASTVIQNALPAVFANIGDSYYSDLNKQLEAQANKVLAACAGIPGLTPVKPQGAMYVMIRIDTAAFKDIADDSDFTGKLLTEQNVMVLPGACFSARNFIRIVFCAPVDKLDEFAQRLAAFCKTHAK